VLPNDVVDTGVENPLTGRDKLEIRKIVDKQEIAGPYYGEDKGDDSIFYTPDDGNDFTFYENPNSNWYNKYSSQNYAQNITSGFSVKNLRTQSGNVYVDFSINDYNISEDATLRAGEWILNSSITPLSRAP
jgi:hypothetical protein